MKFGQLRGAALGMALVFAAAGCAGRWSYRQGRTEARKGNWDMAVARLTKALQQNPENIDYKLALENAKIQASRSHHHEAQKYLAANDLVRAVDELDVASKYDPSNQSFAQELAMLRDKLRQKEDEQNQRAKFEDMKRRADAFRPPVTTLSPRSPIPISLHMPDASLLKVFDTLAQLAGVNILYDDAVRDKQTSVKLTDVTFQEALDQLTFVNKLFYKVIDPNTLIIAPEGPQYRRRYEESLVRTFYIQNADVPELQNTIRQMLTRAGAPPQIAISQNLRAITIAGNADELALAAKIIEAHDKPLGEVLVEVEILDVNRSTLKEYGINLANYSGDVTFDPYGQGGTVRAHLLSSLNLADFVVNIPNKLLVKFLQTDSTARILASPRLRGADGKQTTLRIGTEVPIPVTTFTATNTGTGGSAFSPATSFQYRNVGINMELTPRVNAAGEVTFDPIAAEFSLIGQNRDVGGGLLVPEFLTRNVRGTLRIRDGETALIGGLLQGEAREALTGIIGLQSVPILNRILTSPSKQRNNSEILISLTPHIVRGPRLTDEDLKSFYAGTKENIRVPGSRPPLFGAIEEPPSETPTPPVPPAPTTPPVGVAPPPPPQVTPTPPAAEQPPGQFPPVAVVPGASAEPLGMPTTPPPGPLSPPTAPPGAENGTEQPPVMVIFSPPEVPIKLGEVQSVSIVVLRVKDLVSVDLVLTYDGAAMEAVDGEPGALLTLDGASVSSEKNLEPARVRLRFARPSPTAGTSSGAIATVRLKGLRPGPSTLAIESLTLVTPRGPERLTLPGPGRVVVLP